MQVSRSLSGLPVNGILLAVLLQADVAADPTTMLVYYTDGAGVEYLAGSCVAPAPAGLNSLGNRAVLMANAPGATSYRVVADNGGSPENLDLSLEHGEAAINVNIAMVVPLTIERAPAPPPLAPAFSEIAGVSTSSCAVIEVTTVPASVAAPTVRVCSYTRTGAKYQAVQYLAPSAVQAGGGARATVLVDIPGATVYRAEVDCADPAAVRVQSGQLDYTLLPNALFFPAIIPAPVPATSTQPAALAWVDAQRGNNASAQRGNIDAPFQTIGAAIAAAIAAQPAPTCILVAAGDYAESVQVLAAAGAARDITIRGLGGVRWNGLGASCLSFVSVNQVDNGNIDNWRIQGIDMQTDGTGPAIAATGAPTLAAGDSMFQSGGLTVEDCEVTLTNFRLTYLGNVLLRNVLQKSGAGFLFDTCLNVLAAGCYFGNLQPTFRFDGSLHRGFGRGLYRLMSGTVLPGAQLDGAPNLEDDASVVYTNALQGIGTLACYLDAPNAIDLAPRFNLSGRYAEHEITLPQPIPGGVAPYWNGDGAVFQGACILRQTAGIAPRNTADARGAVFTTSATFEGDLDVSLSGSSYQQSTLAVAAGARVARKFASYGPIALPLNGANVLSFGAELAGPAFPAGVVPFWVATGGPAWAGVQSPTIIAASETSVTVNNQTGAPADCYLHAILSE